MSEGYFDEILERCLKGILTITGEMSEGYFDEILESCLKGILTRHWRDV